MQQFKITVLSPPFLQANRICFFILLTQIKVPSWECWAFATSFKSNIQDGRKQPNKGSFQFRVVHLSARRINRPSINTCLKPSHPVLPICILLDEPWSLLPHCCLILRFGWHSFYHEHGHKTIVWNYPSRVGLWPNWTSMIHIKSRLPVSESLDVARYC